MNDHPAGTGCDDGPRWRWDRRRGDDALTGLSSFSGSATAHKSFSAQREAVESYALGPERPAYGTCASSGTFARCWANCRYIAPTGSMLSHSADLASKREATLWCARSGGPGPSAASSATSERSERERPAVRWAVGADCCGAVGCSRSDGLMRVVVDGESRTLCPAHLARWSA
jgi:hypothetical protein